MTAPADGERLWADAVAAAALLAIDPAGLGGVLLRAQAGPVRERWLGVLRGLFGPGEPWLKAPVGVGEAALLGGLDLAATLGAGRPVAERGLLARADGGVLVLAMAERLEPTAAALLAAALDRGVVVGERDGLSLRGAARFALVALDEASGDDDPAPARLAERMAFHIDLAAVPLRVAEPPPLGAAEIAAARARLAGIEVPLEATEALCAASLALGIASLRAPLLAQRVARARAALDARGAISADDLACAARLVLAPRATCLPTAPEAEPPPEPPRDTGAEDTEPPPDRDRPDTLQDVVLEAARAALPAELLARLQLAGRLAGRSRGRSGLATSSGRRGRPLGTRRGQLRPGLRLHIPDTLRAAAPWQRLRAPATPRGDGAAPGHRLEIRKDDFHIARVKQRTQTTTIFVVDASGSAAAQRMAEAKGAVELLLADCYVRRDQVALIAFRGGGAEILLAPTRSLTRAKRALAGLPAGGGTPLAAGIDTAARLVEQALRRGETPIVVALTDGRANVARDGIGGRQRAAADALDAARRFRALAAAAMVIDIAARPDPQGAELARAMGAAYLPLPRADAQAVSRAVRTVVGDGRSAARAS